MIVCMRARARIRCAGLVTVLLRADGQCAWQRAPRYDSSYDSDDSDDSDDTGFRINTSLSGLTPAPEEHTQGAGLFVRRSPHRAVNSTALKIQIGSPGNPSPPRFLDEEILWPKSTDLHVPTPGQRNFGVRTPPASPCTSTLRSDPLSPTTSSLLDDIDCELQSPCISVKNSDRELLARPANIEGAEGIWIRLELHHSMQVIVINRGKSEGGRVK